MANALQNSPPSAGRGAADAELVAQLADQAKELGIEIDLDPSSG